MTKDFVWAIDEDGKPTKCTAKPENRGKRNCKHQFHQKPGQSDESFFAEHQISMRHSIFEERKVEILPYRMSDEEKLELKEITSRNGFREECDDGAYFHIEEPLWNDMDKNYFSEKFEYDRKLIDSILHEESFIALRDYDDGEFKVGFGEKVPPELLEKSEENPNLYPFATGLSAMNYYSNKRGFEATKDIYVLPYYMRPGMKDGRGNTVDSDETELYLRLFNRKKYSEKSRQEAYENLLNGSHIGGKGKYTKPLAERLRGKKGIWRGNITAFTIPYTGRAVIVPNVDINYDETKIPTSMAANIFKPTIVNNLTEHGFTADEINDVFRDANNRAGQSSPNTGRLIQRALEEENVRVLLDRNPTLHKASMQSFKPKVGGTACVEINPLVCGGFNADFDGDTMAVVGINSAIISQKADDEMHPSNFKFQPRAQQNMNMEPTKDAKWGLMNILKNRSN